ncbi:MAG: hypothetical protein H6926_10285, partial [Chromatiales bacterium]|nr:hypothetical protein [Chromatiales bacterium]
PNKFSFPPTAYSPSIASPKINHHKARKPQKAATPRSPSNPHNTCYLEAIVNTIGGTPLSFVFRQRYEKARGKYKKVEDGEGNCSVGANSKGSNTPFTEAIHSWAQGERTSLFSLYQLLPSILANNDQQDVNEVWRYIKHEVEKETAEALGFTLTIQTKIVCSSPTCCYANDNHITPDDMLMLVPPNTPQQTLDTFGQDYQIPGSKCDLCGCTLQRTEGITKYPPYIYMGIKRNLSNARNPYGCSPEPTLTTNDGSLYELIAVITHVGSHQSGHYSAHTTDSTGKWTTYDNITRTTTNLPFRYEDTTAFIYMKTQTPHPLPPATPNNSSKANPTTTNSSSDHVNSTTAETTSEKSKNSLLTNDIADLPLEPCPHCGLLGNKTQKGHFTSASQRTAHIYRCAATMQREADRDSSTEENDSSSSTTSSPSPTPPLSPCPYCKQPGNAREGGKPFTSQKQRQDHIYRCKQKNIDLETASSITETTVDEGDVPTSFTCPGCGATTSKNGERFATKQALGGHMGKCKAYISLKKRK